MLSSNKSQGTRGRLTRRDILRLGVASTFGGLLAGCSRCDAGFPPNMTMPVFYGYKDYLYTPPLSSIPFAKNVSGVIGTPAPVPMARVFYPSIDGSPAGARILTNCEPFPLVLLVHGDCHGGSTPYDQWFYFAEQLAPAGYVVAVTYAGGLLATGDAVADAAALRRCKVSTFTCAMRGSTGTL